MNIIATPKTTSEFGRLWGWPNAEEEKAYVKRWKKEFDAGYIGNATATSQVIQYPEEGLQCIQVEIWTRVETGG